MKQEVECIDCGFEFESDVYDISPCCPECNKKFIWDSQWSEYEGIYFFPDWD